MSAFGILFTFIASALLLRLPRNLAPLPLLMGAVFITRGQQLEILGLTFPVIRILVAVGLVRVILNRERIAGGMNSVDRWILLWGAWYLFSLFYHESDVIIFRLGVFYDMIGAYYLFRVFVQEWDDIQTVFRIVCIVLIPMAAMMLIEKMKGDNPLGAIGFAPRGVTVTNGHFRASGAFGHPILAGTVGAVCVPMAIFFWRRERKLALIGLAATLAIVFASGSSGPILTTFSVLASLALWMVRGRLRTIRWLAVFLIIGLNFAMNDPVYFLMARIDITGGSTGYFRAQLIRSAIDHLNEWWLTGTDYTRHWMLSGITANLNHTDMTNYYLQMGVWGGLPLMLLFIGVLGAGFISLGKALKVNEDDNGEHGFLIWTIGCILVGHVTTFMSISYFDQTIVFLCLALACIGSFQVLRLDSLPILVENSDLSTKEEETIRYPLSISGL